MPKKDHPPLSIGHRGMVQTFPENTLPGFEACLKAGVGFELDVRRTRDGRLVVLHDATLDRTTNGTGKVADLTLEEVRKLDAGTKYNDKFAGTLVPELAEVSRLLSRQKQPDLKVCIDLKINDGQVEADVVRLARVAGVLDRLLFIGVAIGDSEVRGRLRMADPGAHVCCLADKPEDLAAALGDRHSDWAYVRFIPSPEEMKAIRTARKRVLLVGPLVMNKETENWKKAAAAGVDAILSDYPVGWPPFHVQHLSTQPDAPLFTPGTPFVEIHECVRPLPGERVIRKNFPNSFHQTPLLEELKARGADHAVIVGAMSHMCIDATTRAAYDLGLRCTLIHDACATRDLEFQGRKVRADEVHASFMAALGWWYARLLSAAEYVSEARRQ